MRMEPRWMVALAALAGLGAGALATRAAAGEIGDKAAIERVVHDYLLAHPEIIPEAMQRLQERQSTAAITSERRAIETPFAGAWAGSATPRVTLVMFTDYSCGYCRASAPDVDRLLRDVPDLKVVWREIPILGTPSVAAARAALEAAKDNRYLAFHRGLFAAGRPDEATIAAVARANGLDPAKLASGGKGDDVTAEIASNIKLAAKLGIDGTPAFVVGDRMLGGAVGYEALKQAVDAARKG